MCFWYAVQYSEISDFSVNVCVKGETLINSLELCRVMVSHLETLTEDFASLGS